VPGLPLAWRGGQRWQRGFEPARLPPASGRPARLRDGAVVLVTGGLGGIGQVLALDLAAAVPGLRLGLLGRTALAASAAWPTWLADHPENDRTSQRIRAVLALRAAGAEVELLVADVQDGAALARALDQLRQRFGPVQAVVHAAGLPGGGIIALKTLAAAQAVLAPKVQGTRLLDALLADDPVEAFVLCSSINATLGSAGQVDYTAANAFLDAFALERQAHRGGLTVAIAWDTWREAGMALDTGLPAALAEGRRLALRDGIGNAEGTQLLRRALAGRLSQLVVSTRPLAARLQPPPAAPVVDTSGALAGAVAPPSAHARPAVSSAFRAPSTDTERAIAQAWQAALAIDGIGVEDDFFDLGGHSLMAIQLVARLRAALGVPLSIERFLELPTVAQLAGHVEALAWTQGTPTAVAEGARDEYAL
jgi:NAD(P)-dependent dehydrogenase (short-subunit alcohol dehydrogenase family)/acyl carrier protein